MTRVAVLGAKGRMGSEVVRAVSAAQDLELGPLLRVSEPAQGWIDGGGAGSGGAAHRFSLRWRLPPGAP